jgi:hypothetical protein
LIFLFLTLALAFPFRVPLPFFPFVLEEEEEKRTGTYVYGFRRRGGPVRDKPAPIGDMKSGFEGSEAQPQEVIRWRGHLFDEEEEEE